METAPAPTHDADRNRLMVLDDPRGKRILAKTIYRELRGAGAGEREIIAIATELLGLVAEDLRADSKRS